MNTLLHIFLIILLLVFQTTFLHSFTVLNVRPDTILIFAAFVGMKLGGENGALAGFVLGLAQDSLSSGLLGANALSKGIIGFIFGNLRDKIVFENTFSQVLFILFASFIDMAITLPILFLASSGKAAVVIILKKQILSCIFSALTGPLFIKIFIFAHKKLPSIFKKWDHGSKKRYLYR